jgi:hypothetical protein
MRKFRIIMASLVLSVVHTNATFAEPVPAGCYVTDAERSLYQEPPTCYVTGDGSYQWVTPARTVGSAFAAQTETDQGLIDAYGTFTTSLITLAHNFFIVAQDQISLVRRLRRACGTKCRRIK